MDLLFTAIHIHEIPGLVHAAEICIRLPAALGISAAIGMEASVMLFPVAF